MTELNEELWKLGITAKTQHNEVAPAQHELAPIYDTTNIATDHNQLIMEIMKKLHFAIILYACYMRNHLQVSMVPVNTITGL